MTVRADQGHCRRLFDVMQRTPVFFLGQVVFRVPPALMVLHGTAIGAKPCVQSCHRYRSPKPSRTAKCWWCPRWRRSDILQVPALHATWRGLFPTFTQGNRRSIYERLKPSTD